jgi:hypothetical protein
MNGDESMDEKWKDLVKQLINSINGWISSNSNNLQYMNYVFSIKFFKEQVLKWMSTMTTIPKKISEL